MISKKDIGKLVQDLTGEVGILLDVISDWEDARLLPSKRDKVKMAFVGRADGLGGREREIPAAALTRVP